MIIISFLLLVLAACAESFICPSGQQSCGSSACYDPTIQGCINGGTIIQCINSCNGTCYSDSQYCYNNTIICNNGDLVCDVKIFSAFEWFPVGPTCYNSSQLNCYNNRLCYPVYACGLQCLNDTNSVCVNNQTICYGFYFWNYYYSNAYVNLCGPEQKCYDNTTNVCLNGTTVCQGLNSQLCGTNCFNPDTQICINGTIQCINSCNGTCYSNSQYCYNNTIICNNGDLVCDVEIFSAFEWFPVGPTCYNSSQLNCYNNRLCYPVYACGLHCLNDTNSVCVNNQTICYGFYFWNYYYSNAYVNLCGPEQKCYDNTTSVCLNGTNVCQGLNSQLCGTNCFNPDTQICINGTIQCINSCNGTCYSNSQYCYNNTIICNNGDLVCDVEIFSAFEWFPVGPTCYNSSQLNCYNNRLCYPVYACGLHCLNDTNSVCVNNQTICYGFYFWNYYYSNAYVNLCGPEQKCYDNTTSICLGNNGTVCPIGNQLCSGVCYNPQSQYCTGGNNSIYCLNNPSSSNCLLISTMGTSSTPRTIATTTKLSTNTATVKTSTSTIKITTRSTSSASNAIRTTTMVASSTCCAIQNCTKNSDCCQPGLVECQCYRHSQTDVYGLCINPYITPICGDSCSVQGRCKSDSDCCKCQCATVTFTNPDGQLVTKKQCAKR